MDLRTIGLCLRSPPPLVGGVRKDCTKRFFIYPSLSCNIYGGRIAANSVSSRAKRCHSWPNRAAITRPPESIRLIPKEGKGEDFSFVAEDFTNRIPTNAVNALLSVSLLFLISSNGGMWSFIVLLHYLGERTHNLDVCMGDKTVLSIHSVVTTIALIASLHSVVTPFALISTLLLLLSLAIYLSLVLLSAFEAKQNRILRLVKEAQAKSHLQSLLLSLAIYLSLALLRAFEAKQNRMLRLEKEAQAKSE